jgi:hypothetical protein
VADRHCYAVWLPVDELALADGHSGPRLETEPADAFGDLVHAVD